MDNSFLKHLINLNPDWKSNSRIFGAAIESWVEENINCECSGRYTNQKANQKSYDALCNKCGNRLQIKASGRRFKANKNNVLKILGAEYQTTLNSIQKEKGWDLLLVAYERDKTLVTQVLKIYSKYIIPKCVLPRKKLAQSARRAGWQGCYLEFNWDCVETLYDHSLY